MVAQYADRDDSEDPSRQEQTRRYDHDVAERQLLEAVSWWQRPPVRVLLRLAHTRLPLRGVGKRPFLQTLDVARVSARRIGSLLVEGGTLSKIDDVFQLTIEEITGPIPDNAKTLVARRRTRAESYERQQLPTEWKGTPDILNTTPQPASPRQANSVLTGVGVSAGVREGIVRVVTNPDFADVEPDEILVASTTDPSWASIMFLSSALVVDIGGALSHAAVVARELRIPCVVNTRNGTSFLQTGDRVRVDGAKGIIEILESVQTSNEHEGRRG
jgi:rifampicin phosphotransferase